MARICRTSSTTSGSDRVPPSSASRRVSGEEVERMDTPATSVGTRRPPETRPHLKSAWEPAVCTCDEPHHTFGGRPGGIAVGPDGAVFVSSPSAGHIWRIDVRDVIGGAVPPGVARVDGTGAGVGWRSPTGIAASDDDGVWVADHENGTLCRIDSHGRSTTVLRCAGRHWPVAVAVAAGGAVTAAEVFDEELRPGTCLVPVGTGR